MYTYFWLIAKPGGQGLGSHGHSQFPLMHRHPKQLLVLCMLDNLGKLEITFWTWPGITGAKAVSILIYTP